MVTRTRPWVLSCQKVVCGDDYWLTGGGRRKALKEEWEDRQILPVKLRHVRWFCLKLVLFTLFFPSNWSVVDLQCYVSLCVQQSDSVVHVFTYSSSHSFPSWFITGYCMWFPVLYSRTLLFICFTYSSLYLLTPAPPPFPFGNNRFVF